MSLRHHPFGDGQYGHIGGELGHDLQLALVLGHLALGTDQRPLDQGDALIQRFVQVLPQQQGHRTAPIIQHELDAG